MKQKTEFSESLEEENTYFSENILHPNLQQQEEVSEKDGNTKHGDCSRSVRTSRNFENVIGLEISSSLTTGILKEVVSSISYDFFYFETKYFGCSSCGWCWINCYET
jgi:hypothetical protein